MSRISARAWAVGLIIFGLLERLALWLAYTPQPYSDTASYQRLARAILNGWKGYDGTRTPGYPLALALLDSDQAVWLAQMAAGILVALLLFWIGWKIRGEAWFGGLVGLAHLFNPGQLFFEANLLSETFTTLWVALALAGMVAWMIYPQRRSIWLAAGISLCASLAWLTRPLFIYLPFYILFCLLAYSFWMERFRLNRPSPLTSPYRKGHDSRERENNINPAQALALLLPAVLILGAWVGFIHQRYHMWSLTTMTGYHLVQHTGSFFQYVPDQYAALRDTYIKYRDQQIAETGTQANAIWDAIPDLQKVSGKTFFDLSRLLQRISIQLILQHPGLYLQNVAQGWWYFWRAPVYWSPQTFEAALRPALEAYILVGRLATFAANLVFLLTSLGTVIWPRLRVRLQIPAPLWAIAGSIWAASFLQTLLDHGDNPRFLIPLQSFVILWVLWCVIKMAPRSRLSG
jgi:hypothetical protein